MAVDSAEALEDVGAASCGGCHNFDCAPRLRVLAATRAKLNECSAFAREIRANPCVLLRFQLKAAQGFVYGFERELCVLGVWVYYVGMTGLLAHDDAQRLRSAIAGALGDSSDNPVPVSDPARAALFRVLDVLESSGGAVVLPADAFVSTQQAAELLGVSRMTVVRLIDRGELTAEGGGVHRKIAATEIERYRTDTQARRRAAMRELTQGLPGDLPADRVVSTR